METLVAPKDPHSLVQEVLQGVAAIQGSEDWKKWLDSSSRFWRYSFGNQMLILMQCPTAKLVAGFQAWKMVGRSVNRGEHGIRILAPVLVKEEDSKVLRGFRTVTVFDISQTSGDELPVVYHPVHGEAPIGVLERLQGFIRCQGYSIRLGDTHGAEGYLNTSWEIVLKEGLSPAQECDVLCHELAHGMLGHLSDKERTREEMELEAETTAWMVLRTLGLETRTSSFAYLATWAQGKDRDLKIEKAATRACSMTAEILAGLERG